MIIADRPDRGNGPGGSFVWGMAPTPDCPDIRAETMESAAKRRLGDLFVERKLITPEQLQEALEQQRATGGKLGEVLVELGFVTRVALAGIIAEQWDELRLTQRAQRTVTQPPARPAEPAADAALRERLDALTTELAERDRRIAQQDATIAALISQLGGAAA
ncbi:MAG TPA: hypothetical protein VI408_11495 [Gaiellaceae bacterium]